MTITMDDCGDCRGMPVALSSADEQSEPSLMLHQSESRIAACDAQDENGRMIVKNGDRVDTAALNAYKQQGLMQLRVRSPLTCKAPQGICARCYGFDHESGALSPVGFPAGMCAGLSIGEPLTQLTFRSFHLGKHYPYAAIARGKPEQDVKFSSGFPRLEELFETLEKRRGHGPALDGVEERPSPQSILHAQGREAVSLYLVNEIARIYAQSGIRFDNRHLECALRQITGFDRVVDPGETSYAPGQLAPWPEVERINAAAINLGKRPAKSSPTLVSMSDSAALQGEWLSSTLSTRGIDRLMQAALCRESDRLQSIRASLMLGRRIKP